MKRKNKIQTAIIDLYLGYFAIMHITLPNFMEGARATVFLASTIFVNIYTILEFFCSVFAFNPDIYDDFIIYLSVILYTLLSWLTFSLEAQEEEVIRNKERRNLFAKKAGVHFIISVLLFISLRFI